MMTDRDMIDLYIMHLLSSSKCCHFVSNAAYVMLDISKPCFILTLKKLKLEGGGANETPLTTFPSLRTGEIGANGKPAVACEVCGKKLADPSSLYRHRKIHSGDKPHQCPHCTR